jgi:protein-S-isoprenylcysteine O-methyltransferase Ste14
MYSFVEKLRIKVSKVAAFFFIIFILFTSSKWEEISFTSDVFFLLGCILVGIASLGRLWCSLYISGYKNDTLVTLGPYSISRNPLYFFSMIGTAGVGFATETLMIPLVLILLFSIYYPSVIRSEETRLLNIHRAEYEEYRRKTPCFFPKVSLLNEPESYTVTPRIFRKNILRALWFIWFIGILELFEAFHETSFLPIYFRIY